MSLLLVRPFTIVLLITALVLAVAPVQQLTLFRNPGGMMLYVTFEYDAAGKNVSRTIRDWGGFVIRRTAVVEKAGLVVQQNYHEGNGDLRNVSTYAYAGDLKTLTISNEFSQILFQASYNTASPNNNYSLSTGERLQYEYNPDGSISLIKIFNKNNQYTHYATIQYTGVGVDRPAVSKLSRVSSIRNLAPGVVEFVFQLDQAQKATAKVFDLQGRLVGQLIDKTCPRGVHRLVADIHQARSLAANGVYILEFSLGSQQDTFKIKVIKQ